MGPRTRADNLETRNTPRGNKAPTGISKPDSMVTAVKGNNKPSVTDDLSQGQLGEAENKTSDKVGGAWNTSRPGTNHEVPQPVKQISMADMVRGTPRPDGPQIFDPATIQSIGYATTSNGIPAIYFSGAEIQKLATSLGHAIVGKFSHSIPSSHQIQKALDNIKFCRGYTWKYINAKHILIQCEDIGDYARLLGGPKGTPVWYVDRHPMRVFKWSPDFDAYCESPIAAIWCNLIGLPIHLFDQAALFAIGKLLGTPIQVDRATANKSRLSFARICVEIDISKPPVEEIVLDIGGRETIQQVKWDKIPPYCRECKHVGHKSDVCYAIGKTERPIKRDYNTLPPKQPQHGHGHNQGPQAAPKPFMNGKEWRLQRRAQSPGDQGDKGSRSSELEKAKRTGPDILGSLSEPTDPMEDDHLERGGRMDRGRPNQRPGFLPFHFPRRDGSPNAANYGVSGRDGSAGQIQQGLSGAEGSASMEKRDDHGAGSHMSTNQYFSLMDNEAFDGDDFEDVETIEMERHPDHDAEGSTLLITEGEDNRVAQNPHLTKCQGGPPHPPGTNLPC